MGEIKKPVAQVFLKKALGGWQEFYAEVDSGAAISFFNKEDCELLGYPFTQGSYCLLEGVGGGRLPCYVHTVEVKIGTHVVATKIAFSDTPPHKQYLGRIDVFDSFEIRLRGKVSSTTFIRES